jgi:hypothetical protein
VGLADDGLKLKEYLIFASADVYHTYGTLKQSIDLDLDRKLGPHFFIKTASSRGGSSVVPTVRTLKQKYRLGLGPQIRTSLFH